MTYEGTARLSASFKIGQVDDLILNCTTKTTKSGRSTRTNYLEIESWRIFERP